MSASTEGYYEKRNELKPSWVKSVELTGSAGQYAVQAGHKCSCRPTDKYFQERVGISLTRNKDKATSDLLVKVSPGTKPWMALSPTSASCHALRCFVLQQLSRHETTPGCDRARSAASVAAPAAGLRGDNTGSSTSDFIGLDGSGPTKKRTGGPLDPGDGETLEHGGSGKKQASAVAAASLALASAGQEMELLMHKHGDLEDKCEELKRKLDEVVKERDELQAKNAGLLAYSRTGERRGGGNREINKILPTHPKPKTRY